MFDIEVPGRSGIEEVNIDALTGKIMALEHEEAKEATHENADRWRGSRSHAYRRKKCHVGKSFYCVASAG